MAVQTDFMVAVNQIAAERGIDPSIVIEAIKEAIESGFKKDMDNEDVKIDVKIDPQIGTITVLIEKEVVERVKDSMQEISLTEAKKLNPDLKIGDHIYIDITPEGDFGRIAAQAARQVILQKIREAERDAQVKEFEDKIGQLESAVIQRMDKDRVIWEINKAIAIMLPEDRVPTEFYKSGERHKVLLKSIEEGPRGKTLYVSRSDPNFLRALFEMEVPEILSGTIEIKAIAREAGSRSKVAVYSLSEGIDPIGSCVGQRGVRINAIMNELKMGRIEEKVDIILWDEDTAKYISNALSPAQTVSVTLNEKEKTAKVIVPDEQLSLAIGKDGQNVRLAVKLTGWKIDIQGETVKVDDDFNVIDKKDKKAKEASQKGDDSYDLDSLKLSNRIQKALQKANITSKKELTEKIKKGEKISGIGPKAIEEIKKELKI